jgi:predicted DNA-binding ribbon-helix-helix protein
MTVNSDMRQGVCKHSLSVAGHRTSISLESAFWDELKEIAKVRGQSVASLIASIDVERGDANLSSAIRVFVLKAARHSPKPASQGATKSLTLPCHQGASSQEWEPALSCSFEAVSLPAWHLVDKASRG